MIKDGSYVTIQSWMATELGLKNTALLVYAIIFGFSQDGETEFSGSLKYLCAWTGVTKQTVLNTISELIEKGFIEKHEKYINNVKFCTYSAFLPVVKKLDHQSNSNEKGGQKILLGGQKIRPNNIDNNIEDKIDLYNSGKKQDKNSLKKEFIVMVLESDFSENMKTKIFDWVNYKDEIKSPYKTSRGFSTMLAQINTAIKKHGEDAVMKQIDYAISREWIGINLQLLEADPNNSRYNITSTQKVKKYKDLTNY